MRSGTKALESGGDFTRFGRWWMHHSLLGAQACCYSVTECGMCEIANAWDAIAA